MKLEGEDEWKCWIWRSRKKSNAILSGLALVTVTKCGHGLIQLNEAMTDDLLS